jgi:hypothetical protein
LIQLQSELVILNEKSNTKHLKVLRKKVNVLSGFKLHLIINERGEILDFLLTQGNVDDREPLKDMNFHTKIFGNRRQRIYRQRFILFVDGVHLVTKLKKNMIA